MHLFELQPTTKMLVLSLFILSKHHCQTYEELNPHLEYVLDIENNLNLIKDDTKYHDILTILSSGLEKLHDWFSKLDHYNSRLFFRPQPLIEKMGRVLEKLVVVAQQIPSVESDPDRKPLNFVDLIIDPFAKEFWASNFSEKESDVSWETFREAFENKFGEQTSENMKRIKKLMGVDSSQHDMANIYDFADFSDTKGLEESVQRVLQRCTSSTLLDSKSLNDMESMIASELQVQEVPVNVHSVTEEQEKDFVEHPIQVNAVWNGVCSEGGCPTVDMILHITEMDENRVKGEIFWNGDVQTRFKGTFLEDNLTFSEYKVVKGIGLIPTPNQFIGKFDANDNSILGKWYYQDQQGKFQLHFDLEATKLAVPEKYEVEDTNTTLYEGYLYKLSSGLTRQWQYRYFTLTSTDLVYAKSKEGSLNPKKIRGTIQLTHIISIQEEHDGPKPHSFEIITSDRTYHLHAENFETKEKWINALKSEIKRFKTDTEDLYNI